MSRESELLTFRSEGGVWNKIDYEKVATMKSWYGRQCQDVKKTQTGDACQIRAKQEVP